MEEQGIIKKIDGDIAKVAFVKKGGCGGGCSSCESGGCNKDTILLDVKITDNVSVGDKILIGMDSKNFSSMSFWAYIFPTIITLSALILSILILGKFKISNYEVYSILIAFAAMIFSYKIGAKLNKNTDKFSFKMLRKLDSFK